MRADVAAYELFRPSTLGECLALLRDRPGEWRPIAGGTDLMVLFSSGRLKDTKLVDLWGLRELRGIVETEKDVTVGALTTYAEVQENATMRREFPMLCQAASETGGLAIQNRGTLGGNIVNASPAADSPPALLAYDAEIEVLSASGNRWVRYRGFHTGYKQMILRKDELVGRIRLARSSAKRVHYYRKVGPRKAQAISKVCVAACVELGDGGAVQSARIAVGGVAPIVLPCEKTEALLREKGAGVDVAELRRTIGAEVTPIDDVRSTARYRRRVTENLVEELAQKIARA